MMELELFFAGLISGILLVYLAYSIVYPEKF